MSAAAEAWGVVRDLLRAGGALDVTWSGELDVRGADMALVRRLRALPRAELVGWAPAGPPPPREPVRVVRRAARFPAGWSVGRCYITRRTNHG